MDWKRLIDDTRLGCESSGKKDNRNSYYRDFDRIVFSKEFRLLQAKTQVVPFPERDATHTRLTHSIETASVGRSLGILVAERLKLEEQGVHPEDIGAIVAAASLCHDIGNPPLGHSGEDAISQFFLDPKGSSLLDKLLTEDQRYDFQHFEGNAIGFNLLTYSNPKKTEVKGGLGLTYSTLAAFTKYPNRYRGEKKEREENACYKKAGLLKHDVDLFAKIANQLGLTQIKEKENTWCRHPLAYLTEAADDICYAVVDMEDGYRNGSVSFDEAHGLLLKVVEAWPDYSLNEKSIKDNDERIGYLRAKAINSLIQLCVNAFEANASKILDGSFKSTLIKSMPKEATETYKALKDIEIEKVYTHNNILLTEAAGFVVLPGLLDIMVDAAFSDGQRSKKIQSCILKDKICTDNELCYEDRNYQTLLNIVKHVAFMTDTYAVKLYRELTGIQLPNY